MKPDKTIEQKLENLADALGTRDSFVNDVMARIKNSPVQPSKKSETGNHVLRRILMKNPLTKYAAAAVILIGISLLFLFPTGGESIALAAVYDKVLKASAFMYEMSATITDSKTQTEMEATVIISNQYGMKMESTAHMTDPNLTIHLQTYITPGEKTMVVWPELKMYQPMGNPGIDFEQLTNFCNLRELFKELMTQTTQQYTDLGRSETDGITVQGFQIDDEMGESTTTLWADVETQLLVKFEVDTIVGERENHIVMDQFEWDIPIDASDFKYVIPDDYKEMGKTGTAITIDPGHNKILHDRFL